MAVQPPFTPTSITYTYVSTYASGGVPTATSTVNIPFPEGSDFSTTVKNAMLSGGIWFMTAAGVLQFIAWSQIISATAQ